MSGASVLRRAASGRVQHAQLYRKLLLRRHLLRWAPDGPAYVPFIGDGDIAAALYSDRRIYGADLDADRIETAGGRDLDAQLEVADCDSWPFAGVTDRFALADFDSYSYPYHAFRAFWTEARKTSPLVMFFTDGERQGVKRSGSWTAPDGTVIRLATDGPGPLPERRRHYNAYLGRDVRPWFIEAIRPWRVVDLWRYTRGDMLYWGAAITNTRGGH